MSEESVFEFPCDFPIKVVGRAEPGFESVVVEIVSGHVAKVDADRISSRLSRDGNFISVTLTIVAENRPQLDAIYEALSGHDQVMMVL
jgi:putative lipoic acid-binding regulatory protein